MLGCMRWVTLLTVLLGLGFTPIMAADLPVVTENSAPDDRELTHFVSAFVRLIGVQHGYMMMMHQESDPIRLAEMKRHAAEDMISAVERNGLSVERYNAIAIALKQDPNMQDRVASILHQMANSSGDGTVPPDED